MEQGTRQNKMAQMPIPRLVADISIPLVISLLVQSLYNIVDGIFVAKISEDALTATSLAYPAQMLMIAVSVGTGVGVNSLLSRTLGKKDFGRVNKIATTGLILAIISSLIFVVFGILGVSAFLGLFTSDIVILQMGTSYLRICMIISIGIFLATTGERLLQATGNTFLSMIAQCAGAITNIILDPLLIFGCLGLPKLGIVGAAIATVIGQCVAAALALYLNAVKNKDIHFELRSFTLDGTIVQDIYKVGIPTMLVQGMGSIMVVGMNKILIPFSTTAVSLFGIYYKLQNFVFMPVNGLAQGLLPIVGYNYGAKNGKRVSEAFKVTLAAAMGIMAIGVLIFMIAPKQLLLMYSANEQMLLFGIPALRKLCVTFFCMGATITIGYFFSGIGNGLVNLVCTLIRQLLVLLPCAYLFSSIGGMDMVWYAFWIAEILSVLTAVIWFTKDYKKRIRPIL